MHLILYGKPGCHLCEIVEQLLLGLRREFDFELEKVDITTDPGLVRTYGVMIPVVVINQRTVLRAPIHTQNLRAALSREER